MYDTNLSWWLREYGAYGVGKSVQVIGTGYQYILYPTGLQVCEDTHPEGGTLWFTHPHAKNFLQAVLFQSDTEVDSFVGDLPVVSNFEDNTVHPNDEIDRVQRAVLPFLSCLIDFVRNDGDGRGGEFYLIDLAHLLFNIGHTHSFGI